MGDGNKVMSYRNSKSKQPLNRRVYAWTGCLKKNIGKRRRKKKKKLNEEDQDQAWKEKEKRRRRKSHIVWKEKEKKKKKKKKMKKPNSPNQMKKKKWSKFVAGLWLWDPVCSFNYENAIENRVMKTENT